MKRYAIVRNASGRDEATAYLPDNYKIIHEERPIAEGYRPEFVIQGEDKAGWTLDGYVIPRYASGLIHVEEIDLSHPIMKEIPAWPTPAIEFGICVDHHCDGFERRVAAHEGDRCEHCGQLLMHESGLTWSDAKAAS